MPQFCARLNITSTNEYSAGRNTNGSSSPASVVRISTSPFPARILRANAIKVMPGMFSPNPPHKYARNNTKPAAVSDSATK